MSRQFSLFLLAVFGLSYTLLAQSENRSDTLKTKAAAKVFKLALPEVKDVELVQQIQVWDIYTFENAGNFPNERRNDIYLRRGRTGFKGKIYQNMSFQVIFAYDGVGRDKNTPGNGNANASDNREFFLWDAFWTWSIKPMLNVTLGYFRPQVGREHMTSGFQVISMEKSLPNFIPRTFLVGRGSGRETGLNLGGLHKGQGWSFNYNLGYFDLTHERLIGTGARWFPLLTARTAFTLGDPEIDAYKISYVQSFYGQRKGVTLAFNGTYQGETEIFRQNSFVGIDLLANYGPWDFVVEYDWLYRDSFTPEAGKTEATLDKVYSFKAGYNFVLSKAKILQISGAYSNQVAEDAGAKPYVNAFTTATDQKVFDVGLNYLLNKDKLKMNLHYFWGKREDKSEDPAFKFIGAGFQFLL